jgi:hypothetical protein
VGGGSLRLLPPRDALPPLSSDSWGEPRPRHAPGGWPLHPTFQPGPWADGPLFRGRYQAILVEANVYLSAVVRYIHWNPVAAGLVVTPEAYPWSSHRYYLSPRRAPPWLAFGELLATLGGPRAFHRFVLAGNAPNLEQFYARSRQQPVLGGGGLPRTAAAAGEGLGSRAPPTTALSPAADRDRGRHAGSGRVGGSTAGASARAAGIGKRGAEGGHIPGPSAVRHDLEGDRPLLRPDQLRGGRVGLQPGAAAGRERHQASEAVGKARRQYYSTKDLTPLR